MSVQTFKTNKVRKRCVIINAENLNNFVALQDSVFPLGQEGHLNTETVFSQSDVKGEYIKTPYDNKEYGCVRRRLLYTEQ